LTVKSSEGDRTREGDRALWRRTAEVCEQCLGIDRAMAEKIAGRPAGRDVDEYLDPALWEHFVEARRDLVDFAVDSVAMLARRKAQDPADGRPTGAMSSGEALSEMAPTDPEQAEIEKRLLNSMTEMLALEERLTGYLTQNLEILRTTIDELSKNQVVFSQYARQTGRPEPGYLSSRA
jgi:hypothetical protein